MTTPHGQSSSVTAASRFPVSIAGGKTASELGGLRRGAQEIREKVEGPHRPNLQLQGAMPGAAGTAGPALPPRPH